MKKKLLAMFIMLAMLVCLLPATAIAAPKTAVPAPSAEVPEEEPAEAVLPEDTEEAEEADADVEDDEPAAVEEDPVVPEQTIGDIAAAAALAAQIEPDGPIDGAEKEPEYVTVLAEDIFYAYEGMIVFNNGGTVYNNLALVYNNGGTVYNNGGTVYRNGALVYTFDGDILDPRIYGYYLVSTAADYSALIDLEGLNEDGFLTDKDTCTIRPHEGYRILEAETDAGLLTANEDGSYTLSELDADCTLTLRIQADAPVFDLAEGTYAGEQTLTITAPEGAAIYFTVDGSVPSEEEPLLYLAPLVINEGLTVTAVAIAPGAEPSELTKADYAFLSITAPKFEDQAEGYTPP